MTKVIPVILSGGSGTRLWPLSRQDHPKQLLPILGEKTLLQQTALRFQQKNLYEDVMVICNEAHRFSIAEQLQEMAIESSIIIEPCGRNTAPAAAVAALIAAENNPDAILLIAAADHVMQQPEALHKAVQQGVSAAQAGHIVAIGIKPEYPETGYGYLQRGEKMPVGDVFTLQQFIEKPEAALAEKLYQAQEYYWNAGLFLFKAAAFLEEMQQWQPAMLALCRKAVVGRKTDLDFMRLEKDSFAAITGNSIDYAIMEKTKRAAMVAGDAIGWSDIGSWQALYEKTPANAPQGNVCLDGKILTEDTKNCYIRTHGKQMIATIGVENLVVVATKDAILVADKTQTQKVKNIVARLQQENRCEAIQHRTVYRPWGSYESVDDGDRYQVKRIVVKAGQRLSLQKHFHRAEHWVVVEGTARVTRDAETLLLQENESVYLPLGCVHRLENPGKIPLVLIEVQSGSYLGEDDIIRLEDTYGRVG